MAEIDDVLREEREAAEHAAWLAGMEGKTVLHIAHRVVGKVRKAWTGADGDRYVGNAQVAETREVPTILSPVLELEDGNAFVARRTERAAFVVLSDRELAAWATMREAFAGAMGEMARFAASAGLARGKFFQLLVALLREQERALAKGGGDAAQADHWG